MNIMRLSILIPLALATGCSSTANFGFGGHRNVVVKEDPLRGIVSSTPSTSATKWRTSAAEKDAESKTIKSDIPHAVAR